MTRPGASASGFFFAPLHLSVNGARHYGGGGDSGERERTVPSNGTAAGDIGRQYRGKRLIYLRARHGGPFRGSCYVWAVRASSRAVGTPEAHDLLFPGDDWFTEGFDTADLKDAKALSGELQ